MSTQISAFPDFTSSKEPGLRWKYDPANAADWSYRPNIAAIRQSAAVYRKMHNIKPAAMDTFRIHVLGIDNQKDFCFPEGTLYVGGRSGTGAIDDSRRFTEFLYRNLPVITDTTLTLDTHFPYQIFFGVFWLDQDGNFLLPHDEIDTELNILRFGSRVGKAQPNPVLCDIFNVSEAWMLRQGEFYCAELAKAGKYTLHIWPEHTMLGTEGHNVVGVIQEACLLHALVRGRQASIETKGGNPLTENYSIFRPEVTMRHDGKPLVQASTRFLDKLLRYDALIIGGQAGSHCVKSSIDDLLELGIKDRALAAKVYILRDCTSAVTVPDPANPGSFFVDYTPQMEQAFEKYADAGMNIVTSTDPISSWPGMRGFTS